MVGGLGDAKVAQSQDTGMVALYAATGANDHGERARVLRLDAKRLRFVALGDAWDWRASSVEWTRARGSGVFLWKDAFRSQTGSEVASHTCAPDVPTQRSKLDSKDHLVGGGCPPIHFDV